MRIVFLTQFFDPEPVFIPGLPLAAWLVNRGHDVEVVTGFPNYPGGAVYPGFAMRPLQREVVSGVRITRVPLYPSHDRSAARRAANYLSFALSASTLGQLRRGGADVAYVYHSPATAGIPALLSRYLRRLPYVLHVQDLWPEAVLDSGMLPRRGRPLATRLLSTYCDAVYGGASALLTLSSGFRDSLIARGVPEDKVVVVPNWTDESLFYPREPDAGLAEQLGLSGYFNIVYAGNLGTYQGLEVALRAASRVRHLTRLRLVFAGSGSLEHDLRRQADEMGLENVRFLGRWPYQEMGALNAVADVLMISLGELPALEGTIPGKTQVALASGRPIVAAVKGSCAAMIESSGAGLVCPPGDEAELAAAFEKLYWMSLDELAVMGRAGSDFYTRELSLDRGASRLEGVLQDAAAARSR